MSAGQPYVKNRSFCGGRKGAPQANTLGHRTTCYRGAVISTQYPCKRSLIADHRVLADVSDAQIAELEVVSGDDPSSRNSIFPLRWRGECPDLNLCTRGKLFRPE